MLEALYGAGIRREETLALTIYDADLVAGSLRIEMGKGRQTRIVPLTQSAIAALKLYLEEVRPQWASEAGGAVLFVSSRSGRALSDNDLLRIVRKAARRAGIKKRVTPQDALATLARHTCFKSRPTSARYRNCSAIGSCRLRRSTRMSRSATWRK